MILTFVILAALYFALAFAVERSRSRNLDIIACDFRDQLQMERAITVELVSQLDDATRNAAYWQERTDALLCENSTLVVDLMHSEQHASYCRSHRQHKKGVAAGFILVTGMTSPSRKMHAWKVGAP